MNLSAVADSGFIDAIAVELGIPAALVEKDWYVVQILRVIAGHTGLAGHVPAFGGGTSLSKGFGIIKRLSENSSRGWRNGLRHLVEYESTFGWKNRRATA